MGGEYDKDVPGLMEFNDLLERDSCPTRLNEALLEKRLNELEAVCPIGGEIYWLTIARINELTLLCAANYADNCEFSGVGDLLLNPRRVLVHIRGMSGPVIKKRHLSLTEQFGDVAATRGGVIAWLKNETVLEIKEKALLPHLYDKLDGSGVVSHEYLDSVNDRMRKIADVTGLLASIHLPKGLHFYQWLRHASDSDREFVESKLCRFDTEIFSELGHELEQLFQMRGYVTRFLGKSNV